MGLLRGFFATALASVHIDMRECRIQLKVLKNGNTIKEESITFQSAPNALPIEAAIYLTRIKKKYPFTYIATISHTIYQGALNASSEQECKQYGINPDAVRLIIVGKKWAAFIDKSAIIDERNNFAKAPSLDLLYSPFLILYQVAKNQIDHSKKLFILQQQASVAMMIMDNARLYFGAIQPINDNPSEEELANNPSTDDSALEEVGQLSDLDNLETQGDFQDSAGDINDIKDQKQILFDFSRVVSTTNIIKNALNEFYNNDNYESDFINEIVVVDGAKSSKKAMEYLETNLMINTHVISADIPQIIMEIAQRDLVEV